MWFTSYYNQEIAYCDFQSYNWYVLFAYTFMVSIYWIFHFTPAFEGHTSKGILPKTWRWVSTSQIHAFYHIVTRFKSSINPFIYGTVFSFNFVQKKFQKKPPLLFFSRTKQLDGHQLPTSPSSGELTTSATLPLVIREKDVEYQVIEEKHVSHFLLPISVYEGFRDKMRHIHCWKFLFYKLKQLIWIIPTTYNFCFIAHVKNVHTKGNQRL